MKIICFGDSLTSCGGENGRFSDILQDRFPQHTFINSGVGGETIEDALVRLDSDVLSLKPDIVLVEFGANDWWRDERHYSKWADDLERIVSRIKHSGAQTVVLGVFGPYRDHSGNPLPKDYGTDTRAESYRGLEKRVASSHGCLYHSNIQERIIDQRCCWRDRNHPNEFGNRHVADTIEPLLEQLIGQSALPVRKPDLRTTGDMWREAVRLAPDKTAVVHKEKRLTFKEADAAVERLAAGLFRAAGARSPKVAVFLPNCLEYFLLYWAVARLGGVIVPLNTWLKREGLASIFKSVQPDILIVRSPDDKDVLMAVADTDATKVYALDPAGGDLMPLDSLATDPGETPEIDISPDAVSIIMHTSGTTGAPKGAVMRHCDLMFNVMTAINAHDFRPGDVHLLVNPMFHCTALYSSLPTAAYQKAAVVITAETFPKALMRLVAKERITTFLSVPSVFQRIVALPDIGQYEWESLRLIAYAGSMMPVSAVRDLQRSFPGVELHNFFGLTETISMTHVLTGDEAEDRPDSIGRLLPFVEAIVIDKHGNKVAPGTVGELLFARDIVIPAYFNQPGKLEESVMLIDGREFFRTGDLATVDEDGYFFIKGRQKDMVIVGGENVYCTEVEGVLMSHEKVREAAVKGVPATGVRKALGELIKAYVVAGDPSLSVSEIRKFCHERLPVYKIPHIVEFLEALPRNPVGKVVKSELP